MAPTYMIAEKAAGKSFRGLVHEMVIEPHGLTSTFYEASTYPEPVIKRLSHGYFENEACAEYQPKCKESWNAPIIGRDMRTFSTSWMQSAGGAVSNARDVDRWGTPRYVAYVVHRKGEPAFANTRNVTAGTETKDNIGNISTITINGYENGTELEFAVSAYDSTGLESGLSDVARIVIGAEKPVYNKPAVSAGVIDAAASPGHGLRDDPCRRLIQVA